MAPRDFDPSDYLEPPDHSGDPNALPSADDPTHVRDVLFREAGQRLAGRWRAGRWDPPDPEPDP